jgi:hypothetical protein
MAPITDSFTCNENETKSSGFLQAVLYQAPSAPSKQPLLLDEDQVAAIEEHQAWVQLSMNSICIGLFFGVFLQLCTLGVNAVLITFWKTDLLEAATNHDVILISILWSFLTSMLSMRMMHQLRSTIVSTFDDGPLLDDLILHIESLCWWIPDWGVWWLGRHGYHLGRTGTNRLLHFDPCNCLDVLPAYAVLFYC